MRTSIEFSSKCVLQLTHLQMPNRALARTMHEG
jgi:hypothetical protein